jgi:hypothetical protein
MAWTQADVDKLKAQIAAGVTKVDYGDRSITYASISDMLEALGRMETEVAAQAGAASSVLKRSYVTINRR